MKQVIALESTSKKKKNNRSQFLSALMKGLGGDTGNAVADAFAGTDVDKFKSAMGEIVDDLASKMPNASK